LVEGASPTSPIASPSKNCGDIVEFSEALKMLTMCTGVTPCKYCVAKPVPLAPRSLSTLGGLFLVSVSIMMLSILLTRPLSSVTCIVIVQMPSLEEKYLMLRKIELKVVESKQENGVVLNTSVPLLLSKEIRSGYMISEKSK